MDTEEKEWNDKILKLTMQIQRKHPELIKYLDELAVTIPDEKRPKMNIKNLKMYYDSLCDLLTKYDLNKE